MSNVLFAVKCPYYNHIWPFWCGYYAHQARTAVCEDYGEDWKSLYRKGFRIVRIQIMQVNP